jgi:ubiquinone/menaquinone biosynthesis C-methylase UbiE
MMIEKYWNWNKIFNTYWQIPSEDVYYYLYKWHSNGSRKILDLGCGVGRHSLLFASHKFDVTAFDMSESGLDKLKQSAEDLSLFVNIVLGNMIKLPFTDNNFDFILAYNSIYHTDYVGINKVVSEMERILKPDGEIFITLLSKKDKSFSMSQSVEIDKFTKLKKEEDGTELPHYFVNYTDVFDLLKNFEILNIKHVESFYNNESQFHYCIYAKKNRWV